MSKQRYVRFDATGPRRIDYADPWGDAKKPLKKERKRGPDRPGGGRLLLGTSTASPCPLCGAGLEQVPRTSSYSRLRCKGWRMVRVGRGWARIETWCTYGVKKL